MLCRMAGSPRLLSLCLTWNKGITRPEFILSQPSVATLTHGAGIGLLTCRDSSRFLGTAPRNHLLKAAPNASSPSPAGYKPYVLDGYLVKSPAIIQSMYPSGFRRHSDTSLHVRGFPWPGRHLPSELLPPKGQVPEHLAHPH